MEYKKQAVTIVVKMLFSKCHPNLKESHLEVMRLCQSQIECIVPLSINLKYDRIFIL